MLLEPIHPVPGGAEAELRFPAPLAEVFRTIDGVRYSVPGDWARPALRKSLPIWGRGRSRRCAACWLRNPIFQTQGVPMTITRIESGARMSEAVIHGGKVYLCTVLLERRISENCRRGLHVCAERYRAFLGRLAEIFLF